MKLVEKGGQKVKIKRSLVKKIGVLLCLCIVCCSFRFESVTYAKERTIFAEEEHRNKINDTLIYLGYDEVDEVYTTEYASNVDASRIVFLYKEGEMIGEYIATVVGEETYECFIVDDSEVLYNIVTSNGEVQIIDDQYGMRIENEDVSYTIYKEKRDMRFEEIEDLSQYTLINTASISIRESDSECESLILTPENKTYSPVSSAVAFYLLTTAKSGEVLEVDNVANANNPSTGGGLCWSACGACIVNYMKNSSYDALSMYEYVCRRVDNNACGIPKYEKAMFSTQGLQYNYLEGKLHYYAVMGSLKNDSPIMWAVRRSYVDTDGVIQYSGHGVVQCGMFNISDTYGYVYMDPNVSSGYVVNYLDYSLLTDTSNDTFYYYAGGNFYTEVMRCYYYFR